MFLKNFKNSLTIGFFAVFFSVFTAFVYFFTRQIIHVQDKVNSIYLLNELINFEEYDSSTLKDCYLIKDLNLGDDLNHRFWLLKKKGFFSAFIVETSTYNGYSGLISMLVASDFHGNIIGVRVLKHHETPGLGDKIETNISDWITHFSGISLNCSSKNFFLIKKDGGIIDQFTGASITPRAVTNSIKKSIFFILNSLSKSKLIDIHGFHIHVYKK